MKKYLSENDLIRLIALIKNEFSKYLTITGLDDEWRERITGYDQYIQSVMRNDYALKATTLIGYGITDGYTKEEVDESFATKKELNTIESIAKGRATGYVFDTASDLDLWLQNESNVSKLVLGDNFYIKEIDVPDYWWDGTRKQQLETQKVDLSEYYSKEEVDSLIINKVDTTTFYETVGDIETALDGIIAIQNGLIGGDA